MSQEQQASRPIQAGAYGGHMQFTSQFAQYPAKIATSAQPPPLNQQHQPSKTQMTAVYQHQSPQQQPQQRPPSSRFIHPPPGFGSNGIPTAPAFYTPPPNVPPPMSHAALYGVPSGPHYPPNVASHHHMAGVNAAIQRQGQTPLVPSSPAQHASFFNNGYVSTGEVDGSILLIRVNCRNGMNTGWGTPPPPAASAAMLHPPNGKPNQGPNAAPPQLGSDNWNGQSWGF